MDKRAWVQQLKKHVDTKGADKAAWYVFWNDPNGKRRTKSCGPGKIGRAAALKEADRIHSELVTGTYKKKSKRTWTDLRSEYETKIAARFDGPSRMAAQMALNSFQRVAKPHYVSTITADTIDGFVAKRMQESASKGSAAPEATKKKMPKVSAATVNKELRYVRLILNVAKEWGYMADVPTIRFLKLPKKLPTFIPPDHFAAIYVACGSAKRPYDLRNVEPAAWWRAIIVTAYMTGWRIGQLLSLKWEDLDLEDGSAITRAEVIGNKGKREERIRFHAVVIAHLKPLSASFDQYVFPWNQNKRDLWPEFQVIQAAARLADDTPLPKGGKGGGWYGFHDLRRGFATMNAESMDLFELQGLMQHKSLETTREYVNMAKRYNETVKNLFVPPIPRVAESG